MHQFLYDNQLFVLIFCLLVAAWSCYTWYVHIQAWMDSSQSDKTHDKNSSTDAQTERQESFNGEQANLLDSLEREQSDAELAHIEKSLAATNVIRDTKHSQPIEDGYQVPSVNPDIAEAIEGSELFSDDDNEFDNAETAVIEEEISPIEKAKRMEAMGFHRGSRKLSDEDVAELQKETGADEIVLPEADQSQKERLEALGLAPVENKKTEDFTNDADQERMVTSELHSILDRLDEALGEDDDIDDLVHTDELAKSSQVSELPTAEQHSKIDKSESETNDAAEAATAALEDDDDKRSDSSTALIDAIQVDENGKAIEPTPSASPRLHSSDDYADEELEEIPPIIAEDSDLSTQVIPRKELPNVPDKNEVVDISQLIVEAGDEETQENRRISDPDSATEAFTRSDASRAETQTPQADEPPLVARVAPIDDQGDMDITEAASQIDDTMGITKREATEAEDDLPDWAKDDAFDEDVKDDDKEDGKQQSLFD